MGQLKGVKIYSLESSSKWDVSVPIPISSKISNDNHRNSVFRVVLKCSHTNMNHFRTSQDWLNLRIGPKWEILLDSSIVMRMLYFPNNSPNILQDAIPKHEDIFKTKVIVKTIDQIIARTKDEAIDKAIVKTIDQTIARTINETIRKAIVKTIDQTLAKTKDETIAKTIDKAIGETRVKTIEEAR
ncbi:hypothetical protein FF38_05610, partial [Lucilia cuprina]